MRKVAIYREDELYLPQLRISKKDPLFTLIATKNEQQSVPENLELMIVLDEIYATAIIWDTGFTRANDTSNELRFKKGCAILFARMSMLDNSYHSEASATVNDHLYESCRLATLLYCSRGLELSLLPIARKELVILLRDSLEKTNLVGYWNGLPGALIWCLLVGSTEDSSNHYYSWFISQLLRTLMGIPADYWDELRHTLEVFSWLVKCSLRKSVIER